jgi:hypothetical protein
MFNIDNESKSNLNKTVSHRRESRRYNKYENKNDKSNENSFI